MRKVLRILVVISLLYFLLTALLFLLQDALIFRATKLKQDYTYSFTVPFEEINLKTEDGALLNVIHFVHEDPKGVILYFHGNAGDLSRWGEEVKPLYYLGYDVIIMDYRGYGKSKGERKEDLMYQDALLLYEKINEKFDENEITVYGRSLGSTFATYVASERQPKQLLLETPFYSLESVVRLQYPFVPVSLLLQYRFPTNELITAVKRPITIFHGTADRIVPYENGKQLLEEVDNINFVSIHGGGHNNLDDFSKYWKYLKEQLK